MNTPSTAGAGARLKAADQSAQQHGSAQGSGSAERSCPSPQRFAIEACVVGEDQQPLADVAVELRKDAGAVLRSKTGPAGLVRFEGLEQGAYQLGLYLLDQEAWALAAEAPLARPASTGEAAWAAPPDSVARAEFKHRVLQGECTAKLAQRHGFFVDTLWDWPANAVLKADRRSKYVLAPGDLVSIPALRMRHIGASTGQRYTLRRKGVPERLDIQFAIAGIPRADVAYFLKLRTLDGRPLKDLSGRTTADGRVAAWVPPDTVEAEIALTEDGDTDYYVFAISSLDPACADNGAWARLLSLGFCAGLGDIADTSSQAEAVERFQQSVGLAATGVLDTTTAEKLDQAYRREE